MQFKRKFIHAPKQPTCAAIWLHGNSMFVWFYLTFSSSLILLLTLLHGCILYMYIWVQPLQVHVSDCIGGCQNMRMHLQKAGALSCSVLVFVHLNCRIKCGCIRGRVFVFGIETTNLWCMWSQLMWYIYPSSIESSSQFCYSNNACLLLSILIIFLVAGAFSLKQRSQFNVYSSFLLLHVLIEFIHTHASSLFLSGGDC